jgi:hypothetical protein
MSRLVPWKAESPRMVVELAPVCVSSSRPPMFLFASTSVWKALLPLAT